MFSHPEPPKNLTPGFRIETCGTCGTNIGTNGCNCFRYEGTPAIPEHMGIAEFRTAPRGLDFPHINLLGRTR